MRRIVNKLSSRAGISAAIALAVFGVLAVLSTVVVSTSLMNVQRLSGQRENESRYAAVNSAAVLMRKQLENDTVRAVRTETASDDGVETTWSYEYLPADEDGDAVSGLLKTLVQAVLEDETLLEDPYGRLTLEVSARSEMNVDVWMTLHRDEGRLEVLIAPSDPAVTDPSDPIYRQGSVLLVFPNALPRQSGEPVVRGDVTTTRYEARLLAENGYAQGGGL